jgi:hypothetical protein
MPDPFEHAAIVAAFGTATRKLIGALEAEAAATEFTLLECVGLYGALKAAYDHDEFPTDGGSVN